MLITNIAVTAVYNLRADETLASLNDSKSPPIKVVDSEQELMRHLCMQSMLGFFRQAIENQKIGDRGIANLFAMDALQSLRNTAEYE
ncbi:unnamed protein product [Adineta steineri]|uniref:Uncharacterized protein n=1 Tax=Adineta steineri TaxID=433720 RepID=A0A813ST45_9BILA|nr:unnamed protein product [Adineta steineri]CAF4171244.1 unnamed protein product [Adineta steineri]